MSNISKMFPLIFYLVAVLISLTSMTRMIEEERIEIGTLKAMGYTNMQIISKYIIYSLFACIIGGVLGMTVGLYLLPNIVWMLYSMIYNLPEFYCIYRVEIGLIGIIIAFICIGGATIIVATNELKQMPAVLMRPKPPKKGKRILLERIKFIWKRFNFSQKVTARNIFRYKKRAIMTIIGIAGCTALMLTGFGIRDSVNDIPSVQFRKIFSYDLSISLTNTKGLGKLNEYFSNNENIKNYTEICATTAKLGEKNYNVTVFVPKNTKDLNNAFNLTNPETGEKVSLDDDGIIISDKIADMIGANIGDEVNFIDGDDISYKFKVKDIMKNYVGHYVFMSKTFYENNIKQYKTNVDVLTMTATPIPRTLHMSIVGVRDMSVIYEPPYNRKQVQTYVLEYDQEVIKEAITKELERKGQVFYLFNNVEKIMQKANEISLLVPEAKVVYAHGRMTGNEIEDIMEDFIDGKTDILVCTTILESGIDIPNANTIIVENADRMGLAQLYQIRGRVGRSDRQGYAYITYKKDKLLSEVADKRLKAIKEFTEFGSGFKIAMRDLEIRGAGSLLGEVQHGHLEQVGYDTYCNLLDEVVKEIQGEKAVQEIDVQIDLDVTSYIPDEYISDSSQKIEIYQDIALCKNEEDIQNIVDEMIDRFGNMPEQIENLLDIARIKNLCKKIGINKVQGRRKFVLFIFETQELNININELVQKYRNRIKFTQGIKPQITLALEDSSEKGTLKEVMKFLKGLG